MKKLLSFISVALLLSGCNSNNLKVTVTNPLSLDRTAETVEISASDIQSAIADINPAEILVTDRKGKEIVSQIIYEGGNEPVALIFQPTVSANSKSIYYIKKGIPQKYNASAYGRFVPERMDDYAWENDRIAFRIYGTALIAKDGPSNGLDVWVKRTDRMVIDKWYSEYLAGKNSYHDDNGEGCDCFKVGRTLGAGAMAPFVNDSLWLGINFEAYKTLDNGPIRTSFSLTYPPFAVDSFMVKETRTISLDAGTQMTKVTEEYSGIDTPFTVAAGIAKRAEGNPLANSVSTRILTYRLDAGINGIIYIGTALLSDSEGITETHDHLLIKTTYKPGENLTYYTGSGWSKWGFETDDRWVQYMNDFSEKLANPLKVTLN